MGENKPRREWTSDVAKQVAQVEREAFGKRLRAMRERRNIGQSELARELNISPKTLNNIEYGHAWPSLPLYIALAKRLEAGRIPFIS